MLGSNQATRQIALLRQQQPNVLVPLVLLLLVHQVPQDVRIHNDTTLFVAPMAVARTAGKLTLPQIVSDAHAALAVCRADLCLTILHL